MTSQQFQIKEENMEDFILPAGSSVKQEQFCEDTNFDSMDENFCEVRNENHIFLIEEYQELYFRKKPPDCIIYSEEGAKFEIHKELFCQTPFLRDILISAQDHCCGTIEILCPCSTKCLNHLIRFLYNGEIRCANKYQTFEILDNLNKIFGFPKDLPLHDNQEHTFFSEEAHKEEADKMQAILDSLNMLPEKSSTNGLKNSVK